jgi:hypothetical protein
MLTLRLGKSPHVGKPLKRVRIRLKNARIVVTRYDNTTWGVVARRLLSFKDRIVQYESVGLTEAAMNALCRVYVEMSNEGEGIA